MAITIGDIKIGGKNPFVLIAGPCVIEDEYSALTAAEQLKAICKDNKVPFIYKSSYDKANRTSIYSFRGPGLKKGLKILEKIKTELNIPILSDVHKEEEIGPAAEVLDILQVPAFLCRQTDFIVKIAKTGKLINIKKGQFLAPWDVKNILKKIESAGNHNILITERGTSFGYNNLVTDFRAIPIMKAYGYPVIFDSTHSLQLPGGSGDTSGGQREFIPHMTRAAIAAGCDGVFMEIHPDPDNAPCDGPNMQKISDLNPLLIQIKKINNILLSEN